MKHNLCETTETSTYNMTEKCKIMYNQSIMTAAIVEHFYDTCLCVKNSKVILEDLNIY